MILKTLFKNELRSEIRLDEDVGYTITTYAPNGEVLVHESYDLSIGSDVLNVYAENTLSRMQMLHG